MVVDPLVLGVVVGLVLVWLGRWLHRRYATEDACIDALIGRNRAQPRTGMTTFDPELQQRARSKRERV